MNEISTIQQLNELMTTTYILSVVCAIIFIALAIAVSSMIPWQGGSQDRSFLKRRIWFIVLGCIVFVGFFCYNYFIVIPRIPNVAFKSNFMKCNGVSVGIIVGAYFIFSFIIMKVFPKSKFGSIIK